MSSLASSSSSVRRRRFISIIVGHHGHGYTPQMMPFHGRRTHHHAPSRLQVTVQGTMRTPKSTMPMAARASGPSWGLKPPDGGSHQAEQPRYQMTEWTPATQASSRLRSGQFVSARGLRRLRLRSGGACWISVVENGSRPPLLALRVGGIMGPPCRWSARRPAVGRYCWPWFTGSASGGCCERGLRVFDGAGSPLV